MLILNFFFVFSFSQSLNDRLLEAIKTNNEKEVLDLLRNGVNPNFFDSNEQTPLYYATKIHSVYIVKKLLNAGANPDLAKKNTILPLIEAVVTTDTAIVYLLLDAGANPDVIDFYFKISPLMIAVSYNNFDISELLLYYKANPNLVANDSTALMYALEYRVDTSLLNLLFKYGADPNFHPPKTSCPLFLAMKKGDTAAVEIMKQNGAEYKLDESDLEYAFETYNKQMTNILLPYFETKYKKIHKQALDLDFRYAAREVRKLSGKKYLLPYFNSVFLSLGSSFYFNDFLWQSEFGFHEARYNFNFSFKLSGRFAPFRDLIQYSDNTYYQVRDKRVVLSGEVTKLIPFLYKNNKINYIYINANANYSIGSYKGLTMEIENKFVVGTGLGYLKKINLIEYYIGSEYFPIQNRNPFYLTLGFRINFKLPKE